MSDAENSSARLNHQQIGITYDWVIPCESGIRNLGLKNVFLRYFDAKISKNQIQLDRTHIKFDYFLQIPDSGSTRNHPVMTFRAGIENNQPLNLFCFLGAILFEK